MALGGNRRFDSCQCVYQGVLRFLVVQHVSKVGRLGKGWISILDMDGLQIVTGLRQQQSRKRPMKEERQVGMCGCAAVVAMIR